MDVWELLFGQIGLWVIPLMSIAWIAREFYQNHQKRNEIKFSALVEQRAEKIQMLHGRLVEAEQLLTDLYYHYMPIGIDPPEVDVVKVIRSIREVRDLAREQQILYPREIATIINQVCNGFTQVAVRLEMRELLITEGKRGSSEESDIEQEAFLELKENIPLLREELEDNFRNLLGVRK